MKRQLKEEQLPEKKAEIQHLSRNKKLTELKLLKGYDKLINKNGFKATTIRLLAVETDIAKATIHRYFHSKLGLLDALLHTSDYDYKTDEEIKIILSSNVNDHGQKLSTEILQNYFLLKISKPILQEIHQLKLTDNTNNFALLIIELDAQRSKLFELSNKYFEGTNVDFNEATEMIIGGIDRITNNRAAPDNPFSRMHITKYEDSQRTLNDIAAFIDWKYNSIKKR